MSRMPQVTARELVSFLRAQGFVDDRQSGSSPYVVAPKTERVGHHPRSHGLCFRSRPRVRILKDAGFSVDEYLRLR